jgi:hypothetical protein
VTDETREPTGGVPPAHSSSKALRPSARRFGDAEISRILQTAVELQARSHSVTHDGGRGLTLEEIRQIAQEAGIDPRFVDLAVSDADAPLERHANALAGGAYGWRFHTEVEGEIDDDDRSHILQTIRSVMGQKGEFADVYGRMEWSHDEGLGPTIIGIKSSDGKTEIDVTAMKSGEVGLLYGLGIPFGGVLGGAAVAALVGFSGGAAVPFVAAAGLASYGVGRVAWRVRSEWWERRLRRLVERVSSIAQDAVLPPPPDGDR